MRGFEMIQCEHAFLLDHTDGQVKCSKCGDMDDEMQLFNKGEEVKEEHEEKNRFFETQVDFE
jgi:hypothetical protein